MNIFSQFVTYFYLLYLWWFLMYRHSYFSIVNFKIFSDKDFCILRPQVFPLYYIFPIIPILQYIPYISLYYIIS